MTTPVLPFHDPSSYLGFRLKQLARAGRDARRGWLVHQSEAVLLAPSTLPVSDVFMGYYLSKMVLRSSVQPARAPYAYSAASVRGRVAAWVGRVEV